MKEESKEEIISKMEPMLVPIEVGLSPFKTGNVKTQLSIKEIQELDEAHVKGLNTTMEAKLKGMRTCMGHVALLKIPEDKRIPNDLVRSIDLNDDKNIRDFIKYIGEYVKYYLAGGMDVDAYVQDILKIMYPDYSPNAKALTTKAQRVILNYKYGHEEYITTQEELDKIKAIEEYNPAIIKALEDGHKCLTTYYDITYDIDTIYDDVMYCIGKDKQ